MLRVSGLFRYPVKSCGGRALDEAALEPWGLVGDRRWLVTDPDGGFVTARELPPLLTVDVAPADPDRPDAAIVLTAPGHEPITVLPPDASPRRVGVWRSEVDAVPAAPEASALLSAVTGRDLRLLHLADPTQRTVNQDFGAPDDRVSFADGYPLLVTTEASLAALNHLVSDGPRAEEWPIGMERFRPNLVVAGGEAWAEDGWRRLRVGSGPDAAVFRAVKGCARCVMTTIDPATATLGREPLATLVKHRRWDGQSWFGVNLIPDDPSESSGEAHPPVLRVGDPVEVVEHDPAADGPPR